jgi:hypothetical protein
MPAINTLYKQLISVVFFAILSLHCHSQSKVPNKQLKFNINSQQWLFENDNEIFILKQSNNFEQLEHDMIFVESKNNGFRIPTSNELELLINNIVKLPNEKVKKKCPKVYYCTDDVMKNLRNLDFDAAADFYSAIGARSILGLFKHPHTCNNCINWNKTYRSKVACHKCKEMGVYYCGKALSCPICSGKGFYYKDSDPEKLTFLDFLEKKNLKREETYLYYNNANDFGIYSVNSKTNYNNIKSLKSFSNRNIGVLLVNGNARIEKEINQKKQEDAAKTSYIIQLIQNENIEEAKSEINQLNFPEKFPHFSLLLEKEDSISVRKINKFLSINESENAARIYNKLNNKKEGLKDIIQQSLNKKYSSDTVPLNENVLNELISLNSSKFSNFEKGEYEFIVSRDGSILFLIDDLIVNLNKPSGNISNYIRIEGFENIHQTSKGKVTVNKIKNPTSDERMVASTLRLVKRKNNGKVYKVSVLNNGVFHSKKNVSYSPNIPKNKFWIIQDFNVKTIVNGREISETNTTEKLKEGKFSKRIPKIISRVTIFASGTFWLLLRAVEYSKIP